MSDGVWTFTWDGQNQLTSATRGTEVYSYTYDTQHRRTLTNYTVSGVLTSKSRFIYDGWRILWEETLREAKLVPKSSGQPQVRYALVARDISRQTVYVCAFNDSGDIIVQGHNYSGNSTLLIGSLHQIIKNTEG